MRFIESPTDPNLTAALHRAGLVELLPAVPDALSLAVVAARYNAGIVDRLIAGALRTLGDAGLTGLRIAFARVPGAWELPFAARAALDGGADGVIALGCVIRGETDHYDVIVRESARGLMDVMLALGKPVANGVLACRDHAQALERAEFGEDAENKGAEAAAALLATLGIAARLDRARAGVAA